MNLNIAVLTFAFLTVVGYSYGQQVSETSFSVGISKNYYPADWQFYEEELPTYLIFNGSKSWYSNNHRLSLRKEAGLNLQYAPIGIKSGGMAASDEYQGGITSLFANIALQPRIRISNSIALSAGPVAETLLIGYNNLDYEYNSMIYDPPTFGNKKIRGLNRDYFNAPSFGIKASLLNSNVDAKTAVGVTISYLWTNSEPASFYAESYARFSIVIGFNKQKDKIPERANR